jgi:hypothetical protein
VSDVSARCSSCGREILVSEFVDADSLKCSICGLQMRVSKSALPKRPPTLVRCKQEPTSSPTPAVRTTTAPGGDAAKRPVFRAKRRSILVRVGKMQISDYAVSWVVFIVLAPVLTYVRWSGMMQGIALEDYCYYGELAFFLLYAVVLIEAFREEFFDGLLCLGAPPYAAYYLYVKSDSFFLRALMAAVLVGFGYDIFILLKDNAIGFYDTVNNWLHEGWEGG